MLNIKSNSLSSLLLLPFEGLELLLEQLGGEDLSILYVCILHSAISCFAHTKMFRRKPKRLIEVDKITPDCLVTDDKWLSFLSGIPITADSCAYEPVQKLLAIGTSDGRVKVFGQRGVEKTLLSASKRPYGTKQLQFLCNRGLLLRVTEVCLSVLETECNTS